MAVRLLVFEEKARPGVASSGAGEAFPRGRVRFEGVLAQEEWVEEVAVMDCRFLERTLDSEPVFG